MENISMCQQMVYECRELISIFNDPVKHLFRKTICWQWDTAERVTRLHVLCLSAESISWLSTRNLTRWGRPLYGLLSRWINICRMEKAMDGNEKQQMILIIFNSIHVDVEWRLENIRVHCRGPLAVGLIGNQRVIADINEINYKDYIGIKEAMFDSLVQ